MSVNSSVTSEYLLLNSCLTVSFYLKVSITALRIFLLLPLSALILYLGYQQWKQSFKTASHSDIFTYHMAAIELIWILAAFCNISGTFTHHLELETAGLYVCYIGVYEEKFFHVLTCVERYLAVVHPITYRGLRNGRGVRIRNISTGFAWFLCIGVIGVNVLLPLNQNTVLFFSLTFTILIISFCSISALCVLIRPGEGGREKINQLKLRTCHTITAISSVVWLWFAGFLVFLALSESPLLSNSVKCFVIMNVMWFNLPSCLVLPMLYLQRRGKLSCFYYKNN